MFSAPTFAATNLPAGGDIGEFGAWTTEHNLKSFTNDMSRDLTEFQAGFQNQQLVKDYVPIEAKAGINTKAKSLKVFRELFSPPYAIRTSLVPHVDGTVTKDIPLYAFGTQLPFLLKPNT